MAKNLYSTHEKKQTVFMVCISVKNEFNPEENLIELKSLVEAANFEVVGQLVQNTKEPSVQYLIGTGKLEELKDAVKNLEPNIVVFDNELSGMRIRNLEEAIDCKVVDRSMLILDIFANRATSSEGKLQVELAQLKYSAPRSAGLASSNNRYGGGVGMRGPGETQIELNKRRIEDKIEKVSKQLKELEKHRDLTRKNRKESKIKSVALVGYTNSGKSTLLNTLTKANVLSKDMLFATLDTTSRNLWFESEKQAIITDTVGFVSRLPHEFIEAFKSTLKETIDADLLIVVVDISSKRAEIELKIVFDVLKEIGADKKPYIIALNKIDKGIVMNKIKEEYKNIVEISAKNNINIDILKKNVIELLF